MDVDPTPTNDLFHNKGFYYGLGVAGLILLVALLSKWSQRKNQYHKTFIEKTQVLVEQATRWNSLAQQDTHPIIRLIHSNYALAYAQVTRNLISAEDIETITGIDINELCHYLEDCQAQALQKIGHQVPQLKIENSIFSAASGWV